MKEMILGKALSKLTILYIEDDDIIRQYISEFLQRYTKKLFLAANAEDGLVLYEKEKPDLMIVDINLPKMSGMELISLIREKDEYTRILISTAYTNKEFTLEAIELNITRYLVKPITGDDLMLALQKALEQLHKLSSKYFNIDVGDGFYFNTKESLLYKNNEIVALRKKELELLNFFVLNNNKIVSYNMIENEIWKDEVMTQDAIRSQIRNIRRKTHKDIFINVSGRGYSLFGK
ncbi:MAG: response regulator transcription factor [Campylobacterota bacterium]|nr:response regulator transcription factor [Campylobacterota bacterium]